MEGYIGPYELRGELGRGAMARVWRAWDPNLNREVAIKEPLYDARYSDTMIGELGKRFVAEGRTAAQLNHPGIATIYAADVWDGRPAIVMELVEGQTLAQLLRGGALAPSLALDILDQLLDAVAYAHRRGVIHRDIKPENIYVTYDGKVKLLDFGIARSMDAGMTMGTVTGAVLGTPGYLSPEQALGKTVDQRSDLFSVGVVAYEMLTGRNPFGASEGADYTTVLYRIVHEPVPELPASASAELPFDLRPAIMAALAKDPDDRPSNGEELKAMLHGQAATPTAGQGTVFDTRRQAQPLPVQQPSYGAAAPRQRPTLLPYLALALVGAIVLVAVFMSAVSGGGGGSSGISVGAGQSGTGVTSQTGSVVVSFDGGGADSSGNEPVACAKGETIELPECAFEREGYEFDGWQEKESGKRLSPGDTWTAEDDETVFVASWNKVSVLTDAVATLRGEGHTYALFEYDCDWHTAESECEARGGHLATITSSLEQGVVVNLIEKGSRNGYWAGGYLAAREDWRWVSGETFGYSNWSEGTPDNWIVEGEEKNASEAQRNDVSISENALYIYRMKNPNAPQYPGEWNDLASNGDCNGEPFFGLENIGFVCEWDYYAD